MRKTMLGILLFVGLFMLCLDSPSAATVTGYVNISDLLIASSENQDKPGNSCTYKVNGAFSNIYTAPGKLHCLDAGEKVDILNYTEIIPSTITSCKSGFYYVNHTLSNGKSYKGYVCADHIKTSIDTSKYVSEFSNAGIPEIYYEKLAVLKDMHPNWKFRGFNTGLNWEDAITAESVVGISAIQSTNPLYLSKAPDSYDANTGIYQPFQNEKGGWYYANKATVAYYIDPRNFFDEKTVFMFENLGYNPSYQTQSVIESILSNTDLQQYAGHFIGAATYNGNNVSPVMLAARSRQEVVLSGGSLSQSATGNNGAYSGYYNFYNIGANSSCAIPIECGLAYAKNNNWSSPEIAIKEGAVFLARKYINVGQNTLYFQKWNVTSNPYGNYSHQYMTNIQAPFSEAKSSYSAYSKIDGVLDSELEFIIPVYDNMPESAATLPTTVEIDDSGNTNVNINKAISGAGYTVNGSYITGVNINTTAVDMIGKIKATDSSITASINHQGNNVIGNEILGTSDILTVSNGKETSTFRIVIYGDTNGDGKATAVDYVKIKNYIMKSSGLDSYYKEAADVNHDGKITSVDYVKVKNYILGNSKALN